MRKKCTGSISRADYITIINKIINEFEDIDNMRFFRVTDKFDKDGNINYPGVLDLIFFYKKEKLRDQFSKLCFVLSNIFNIIRYNKKKTSLKVHRPVTL